MNKLMKNGLIQVLKKLLMQNKMTSYINDDKLKELDNLEDEDDPLNN
jgi:hypothetical protein